MRRKKEYLIPKLKKKSYIGKLTMFYTTHLSCEQCYYGKNNLNDKYWSILYYIYDGRMWGKDRQDGGEREIYSCLP